MRSSFLAAGSKRQSWTRSGRSRRITWSVLNGPVQDMQINRRRFEIEISAMVVMATQQPTARELRALAACLDICSELERMGDYAKEIANINIRSEGLEPASDPQGDLFHGREGGGYAPSRHDNLCR